MKVTKSGYNYIEDRDYIARRPEGLDEYILMIIRSPACIILKDGPHFIKGNNVILYRKGTPQFFSANNTPFINDWVKFDMDDTELAYFESLGLQFDTILEFTDVYPLSRFIKLLFIERWSNNPFAEESNPLLVRLLLIKLAEFISKEKIVSSQLTEKLTVLRNDIYDAPQKDWSIDSICNSLSISPSYLHHTYAQLFGNTIKQDVISSRLEYSKYLLTYTQHKITSISRMVGYHNHGHFMYMFKKETGFTPSQYRNTSVSVNKTTNFLDNTEYPIKG